MTRIYLIRHAEAEGNLYRRVHGWYDSLITPNGYRQIDALKARFASIPVDAAYSSDLFRTMTTAQAVCRPKALALTTIKQLREINMGAWEDRPWGEVGRTDGEELARFNRTDPAFCAAGGESFQQVRARMERTLRSIAARHPGQTVAVFSHGCAIRCALAAFLGLSVAESAGLGHSDNTAVSLLEFDGEKVRVVFADDASHLTPEISTMARQSWWKENGAEQYLWFRPLDLFGGEKGYFLACRREAWLTIHKNLDRFDGDAFLAHAERTAGEAPDSLLCAMLGERPVGILHMDFDREADKGVGYIPFCYLDAQTRGRGLGVQLMGQAVSAYRPRGRNYLRLRCAPDNEAAQRFYRRGGFQKIGQAAGSRVPLDLLEKYIGYKDMRA